MTVAFVYNARQKVTLVLLLFPEKQTSHASFPFRIQCVLTSGRHTLRSVSVDVDSQESTTRENCAFVKVTVEHYYQ